MSTLACQRPNLDAPRAEDCCSHTPATTSGSRIEEKVMFVFGSCLFFALMAYGAAMNVLFDSELEETLA